MSERHLRVLAVASHAVQYSAPLFRLMAQDPRLDFHVAYCSLRGAESSHDPDFNRDVKWDIPLLDGYAWAHVPNRGSHRASFFGLYNPGLWRFIRHGRFDAVLCYASYTRSSFWIAYFASKSSGTAFLFGTDAVSLEARDRHKWKQSTKRFFWPSLFQLADNVIVPSTSTLRLIRSLGISPERITLTPYTVDNDWWIARSAGIDRQALRDSLGIPAGSFAVLFCAKLQTWKRPFDLLRAVAACGRNDLFVLIAGDGPLRQSLERESASLSLTSRVKFFGFVNQQALPQLYRAADLMVLPSEYEPFGVVVNEAILCGCPVIASDKVGAAHDLIQPAIPEFIFPAGDIQALSAALLRVLDNPGLLCSARTSLFQLVQAWSPARNVSATVQAVESAISYASGKAIRSPAAPVAAASTPARPHNEAVE